MCIRRSRCTSPSRFPKGDQTAQIAQHRRHLRGRLSGAPGRRLADGVYADKHGRKSALFLSVLLMCFGSLIIALTPSYASIGVLAPTLLVVARLLQGLSVGGEYGTSATYLSEVATADKRGFYSSFQYVTLIAGQLLALVLLIAMQQFLLTPAQFGSVGLAHSVFDRRGLRAGGDASARQHGRNRIVPEGTETPERLKPNAPTAAAPARILTVVGLTMGGTVAFYTYTIYMQKFLANTVGLSKDHATLISGAALLLFALLQPLVGSLSDRIGRRPILIGFGVLALSLLCRS